MSCCCYSIISFIFFVSAFCAISVIRNCGQNWILEGYTIASAVLLSMACFISSLNYMQPNPTHCKFTNSFERNLLLFIGIWNGVSLLVFFLTIYNFPSSSTYETYSIFYLIIFNIPLIVMSISVIAVLIARQHFYSSALQNFNTYFLIYRGLVYIIGQEDFNSNGYFSWSRVHVLSAAIVYLVAGATFRYVMQDRPVSRWYHVLLVLSLQIFVGLSCPLIPVAFMLNFLFLFLQSNPFTINYIFAALSFVNVYILGIAGIVAPMSHILIDVNRFLLFKPQNFKNAGKIIDAMYFCQQCAHVAILGLYFYYAEENLHNYAKGGAFLILLVCVACLGHHVFTFVKGISNFPQNIVTFERTLHIHIGIRGTALLVGLLLNCLFLALAYKEGFDALPRYSMFLMLGFVHFVYSGLSLIFYGALILKRTKEYLRILEEQAQEENAPVEDQNKLIEAIKPITDRSEVQLENEECAVCLSDLFGEDGKGEVSQIKHCGHVFHTNCINQWFTIDKTCPTDRKPIGDNIHKQ